MLEKAYRAKRFDDALAKVKRDLGPDAVILSTRQVSTRQGQPPEIEVRALPYRDAIQLGYGTNGEAKASRSPLSRWLQRSGVPEITADNLAQRVVQLHGAEPANMAAAAKSLAVAIGESFHFQGALGQRGRTVALVGPTGVGKTTTIAKLATLDAFLNRQEVAFVSLDQYRIGGAEQLQQYADLIGCRMESAHDTRSLEIALRRLSGAARVYVDTAGRSPRDIVAIGELADCLHGVQEPVEVALCLPAAMRNAELEVTVDVLAPLQASRLVMTKLDEAVFLGSVLAAQVRTALPFTHFTTGQRVPEDIETAEPGRLAAMLCGDEEEQ